MNSQQKRCIVVTGGASGIGLAMTRYFAGEGHNVIVLDINPAQGSSAIQKIAEEIPTASIVFEECDVSDWDRQAEVFKSIFERHAQIDVVMANAGIAEPGPSDMTDLDEIAPSKPRTKVIDVNLIGVMNSGLEYLFVDVHS